MRPRRQGKAGLARPQLKSDGDNKAQHNNPARVWLPILVPEQRAMPHDGACSAGKLDPGTFPAGLL